MIRILSQVVINRIAAGEVLERPASAVKELVENAVDAGASIISVSLEAGGKNLIEVADNGAGMDAAELELAVERHATSKLPEDDLFNINSFGFRGEALPSIGSVSRLSITSKKEGSGEAFRIQVTGGQKSAVSPASWQKGTKVEVRDLFFATPARLKFLKSDQTETQHVVDVIKRMAMAYPRIKFSLTVDGREALRLEQTEGDNVDRISEILGRDFGKNAMKLGVEREETKVTGFAALPTYTRATSEGQYVFVNNRPVKDKLLAGAIKAAYQDFLGPGRYPVVALFITLPGSEVDVNVHPAKSEVRFRDAQGVRGLVVHALKNAISGVGHRASTTAADFALSRIRPASPGRDWNFQPPQPSFSMPEYRGGFAEEESAFAHSPAAVMVEEKPARLGFAKCQLHETYIVAQTADGLVIVDQHAAHERLVYEKMKRQFKERKAVSQALLIPEMVRLDSRQIDAIIGIARELEEFGLKLEKFGNGEVIITGVPALLAKENIVQIVKDMADEILEYGSAFSLDKSLEHVLETASCHNSVRAGRRLNIDEMNELLRQMESTPHSGQCNHGRPTYVELKLTDIEKLFGRS